MKSITRGIILTSILATAACGGSSSEDNTESTPENTTSAPQEQTSTTPTNQLFTGTVGTCSEIKNEIDQLTTVSIENRYTGKRSAAFIDASNIDTIVEQIMPFIFAEIPSDKAVTLQSSAKSTAKNSPTTPIEYPCEVSGKTISEISGYESPITSYLTFDQCTDIGDIGPTTGCIKTISNMGDSADMFAADLVAIQAFDVLLGNERSTATSWSSGTIDTYYSESDNEEEIDTNKLSLTNLVEFTSTATQVLSITNTTTVEAGYSTISESGSATFYQTDLGMISMTITEDIISEIGFDDRSYQVSGVAELTGDASSNRLVAQVIDATNIQLDLFDNNGLVDTFTVSW